MPVPTRSSGSLPALQARAEERPLPASALALLLYGVDDDLTDDPQDEVDFVLFNKMENKFKDTFVRSMRTHGEPHMLVKARWDIGAHVYELAADLPTDELRVAIKQVVDWAVEEHLGGEGEGGDRDGGVLRGGAVDAVGFIGIAIIQPGISHEAWLAYGRERGRVHPVGADSVRGNAVALMFQDWRHHGEESNAMSHFWPWCVGGDVYYKCA